MKTFKDLEVGDTLYTVIYANDSGYPLKVRKEKITAIEVVKSAGTIIKTADLNYIIGGYHGYFVDPYYYDWEYMENNGDEIHCDKLSVQERINEASAECQKIFTAMLDSLKD